jgi:basic membrane protein A and related proteins
VKVFVRSFAAVALVVALAVAVLGASGSSARTPHSAASSFKLGIVADTGGLNDHGFNHLAYEGALEAQKTLGVKIQVTQAQSSSQYVPLLTEEARNGDNLVVAVGFDFITALGQVAKQFPKTHFAIIDTPASAIKGDPKNVEGLTFLSQQSGYLVGYLAGLVSKKNGWKTISSVGGQDIPSVTAYIAGYVQGGKAADPSLTFLNGFSQNFTDPADCETIADNQISQGSKIVFQVAGGCGLGALKGAQAHGDLGIGVDADQGYLGSYVLTSALKHVDVAVEKAAASLLKGKFDAGGDLVYGVNNDGTGYGKLNSVGKPFASKLNAVLAQIKSGKIKVNGVYKG